MKSSFEALSREFVEKKHVSHTIKQFRDTSVRNMLVKASLAVHSNVIERITKISRNTRIS